MKSLKRFLAFLLRPRCDYCGKTLLDKGLYACSEECNLNAVEMRAW